MDRHHIESDQERRKHGRRACYIIANYEIRDGAYRDIIRNIGAGGLFINTHRPFEVGQEITLSFPLFNFDESMELKCKITRTTPSGFAVEFEEGIIELELKNGEFPDIVHELER